MKTWLLTLWEQARTSLWITPVSMALLAVVFAYAMTSLDEAVGKQVVEAFPALRTTGQAARSSLAALASALVTVVSVVISITVVSLSVTASQFGSRILRIVLRDRVTHVTMGGLLASSLYCLLVLFAVREDESIYTPHLSVAVSIVLGVISLGALLYFTHNIGVRIQAPLVIRQVAHDLEKAIDRVFPESLGSPAEAEETLEEQHEVSDPLRPRLDGAEPDLLVRTDRQGYVQGIDADTLFHLATKHRIVIQLLQRPGDFLVTGLPLAAVWQSRDDQDVASKVQDAYVVGAIRLPVDDVQYAFQELVEIAIRALSPGLNDTFTALTCIEWITAGLGQVAQRKPPSAYRRDEGSAVRLIVSPIAFEELVRTTLGPIRAAGRGNLQVAGHLMRGLVTITPFLRAQQQAQAIWSQACLTMRDAADSPSTADVELEPIETSFQRIRDLLRESFPDAEFAKPQHRR